MAWMAEKTAHTHAIISAYLSIIAGLVEAALSLTAGHAEISMSLYGIALMAIVDITGSVLVLRMWQNSGAPEDRLISQRLQEMQYSITIGVMMIVLGCFLIADSIKNLSEKESPSEGNVMGTSVTIFGAVCGISLAIYKYIVGKSLDSPVVVADSISSLCSGITSLAALVVVLLNDRLWWSDSTAGFTAALYTLYSGTSTVIQSRAEIAALNKLDKSETTTIRLASPQRNQKIKTGSSSDRLAGYQSTADVGLNSGKFIEIRRAALRNEGNRQLSIMSGLWDRMSLFGSRDRNRDYDRVPIMDSEMEGEDEVTFSA